MTFDQEKMYKVLLGIRKELHIQNLLNAMQYIHPNGALYSTRAEIKEFFNELLKEVENKKE